ncbi:hypothetical protein GCM10023144_42150 [Pigmentiphaga soli]|uniref:ABC transporter permease n=1 Tax=Pigmentiphaga soli TaxID=1007095 RepID=A0ABP8HN42_9BURK
MSTLARPAGTAPVPAVGGVPDEAATPTEAAKARRPRTVRALFDRFASSVTRCVGTPAAFAAAFFVIVVWAACGPVFGYSET